MEFLAENQEYRFDIVNPETLPQDYLELLDETKNYDLARFDIGAEAIIRLSRNLEAQVWLFQSSSGGYGLVITRIQDVNPYIRELYIWRIIGHGLYQYFHKLDEQLLDFAKKNSCHRVRAVIHPKLVRLAVNKNTGYESIGVLISKEIK